MLHIACVTRRLKCGDAKEYLSHHCCAGQCECSSTDECAVMRQPSGQRCTLGLLRQLGATARYSARQDPGWYATSRRYPPRYSTALCCTTLFSQHPYQLQFQFQFQHYLSAATACRHSCVKPRGTRSRADACAARGYPAQRDHAVLGLGTRQRA